MHPSYVKVLERDRECVKEKMSLDVAADAFLDEDISAGIWENIHNMKPDQEKKPPGPETSDDEESLVSSIDSNGDGAEPRAPRRRPPNRNLQAGDK